MAQPLNDGETCLEFEDAMGLSRALDKALSMDVGEMGKMRAAVLDYYGRFLDPKAVPEALLQSKGGRVLVNAEENSVRLVFPGMVFPWDVPAEALGSGEEVSGANQ